jgi:uncharacterized membrane protein YeaQ/YmgE (transglycosylase-associated protein family)
MLSPISRKRHGRRKNQLVFLKIGGMVLGEEIKWTWTGQVAALPIQTFRQRIIPLRCPSNGSFSCFSRSVFMFHLIWMFIIGIVVGVIAKWIMPVGHMGLLMTGVLGIVGSFVGGFIARLFKKPADGALVDPAGILLSIVGAVILLFIWRYVGPMLGF